MTIDLVFITCNRLAYTKPALASVLADKTEEFSLTIYDNCSTDGTVEYLRSAVNDPRIADIIFSKENKGQTAAVNEVWSRSKADLVGKLDNDCLVTPGWTRKLAEAHAEIDKLGVVACWHFFEDDFDFERARHKIETFGRHRILRHPWTCGTGVLIKLDVYARVGPITANAMTGYWLRMASAGYINGFYYPLILQEHMDDPKSPHSMFSRVSFEEAYRDSYGYRWAGITDMKRYMESRQQALDNLLDGSYEASSYTGWRGKWNRTVRRMKGLAASRR